MQLFHTKLEFSPLTHLKGRTGVNQSTAFLKLTKAHALIIHACTALLFECFSFGTFVHKKLIQPGDIVIAQIYQIMPVF